MHQLRVPSSLDAAHRLVANCVRHYNDVRIHSALGYMTQADKVPRSRSLSAE